MLHSTTHGIKREFLWEICCCARRVGWGKIDVIVPSRVEPCNCINLPNLRQSECNPKLGKLKRIFSCIMRLDVVSLLWGLLNICSTSPSPSPLCLDVCMAQSLSPSPWSLYLCTPAVAQSISKIRESPCISHQLPSTMLSGSGCKKRIIPPQWLFVIGSCRDSDFGCSQ